MLPIDSQTTNNYINALKAQFGQIRRAEDKSVFFTTRPNTDDSINPYFPLFEDYKILNGTEFTVPETNQALDALVANDSGLYQIWFGDPIFLVAGTGVLGMSNGIWLIPTGAEVTVTQNGAEQAPSAETFISIGDPTFLYVEDDSGEAVQLLPYRGKAFYGHLTLTNAENQLLLVVVKPDKTYSVQTFDIVANAYERSNPVFFTHIFSNTGGIEIYFTGKELTFVDDEYPAAAYVAPEFTYVPD